MKSNNQNEGMEKSEVIKLKILEVPDQGTRNVSFCRHDAIISFLNTHNKLLMK